MDNKVLISSLLTIYRFVKNSKNNGRIQSGQDISSFIEKQVSSNEMIKMLQGEVGIARLVKYMSAGP